MIHPEWSNVDLENRVIHARNSEHFATRTGKERVVPIHDKVAEALKGRRRVGRYVFSNPHGLTCDSHCISRLIKKYIGKSGLPHTLHFHSLRHICAS
jgi:integrase